MQYTYRHFLIFSKIYEKWHNGENAVVDLLFDQDKNSDLYLTDHGFLKILFEDLMTAEINSRKFEFKIHFLEKYLRRAVISKIATQVHILADIRKKSRYHDLPKSVPEWRFEI